MMIAGLARVRHPFYHPPHAIASRHRQKVATVQPQVRRARHGGHVCRRSYGAGGIADVDAQHPGVSREVVSGESGA